MKRLGAIGCGLVVLVGVPMPVMAAEGDAGQYDGSRTPLGCLLIGGTVIAITNTSGATIPDGAAITYDGFSKKYGVHYGKTFVTAALGPGEVVTKQASTSDSCVAWFTQPAASQPAAAPSPAPAAAPAPPSAPAPAEQKP